MDDPRVDASTSYQPHINGNHAGHYNDNINHYGNANGNGHGLTCDPSGHGVTVEDSQVGIQASQGHDFPATQEISSQPQGTPGSSANRADGRRTPPPPKRRKRWGLLIPAEDNDNPACQQIELKSTDPCVIHAVGRNPHWIWQGQKVPTNTVLRNGRISGLHCTVWREFDETKENGEEYAIVMIEDHSTNGTYLRGEKLGKGNKAVLLPGTEITLGPVDGRTPMADYFRWIYQPVMADGATRPKPDPNTAGGLYMHYEVYDAIGAGSFATVHRAVERATGKWRAIKAINKARLMGNKKTREMLKREVSIMRSLSHPNVVQYIAGFEDRDTLWLVMELVDGGDLLDYIRHREGLEEDDAAEIAYQTCEAIAYLHQKGIAHRDLKPENLLLTSDPNPIVKVADFGLAKLTDDMLRTMCGTPSYLAPEVILQGRDTPGYNFAVDAWSIGVVVFSALANASPFVEDDSIPLHERMRTRQPDMKLLFDLGCSEQAMHFVARLLTTDPAERMTAYDALKHPWLQPARERRRSSAMLSFLMPSSSPPALPESQPRPDLRVLPSYLLEEESSSFPTPSLHGGGRGDSSARTSQSYLYTEEHENDEDDDEDEDEPEVAERSNGNASDAHSQASYSQKMGRLRIQSDLDLNDSGAEEERMDEQARTQLPCKKKRQESPLKQSFSAAMMAMPATSYQNSNVNGATTADSTTGGSNGSTGTSYSLKRKQPASHFSADTLSELDGDSMPIDRPMLVSVNGDGREVTKSKADGPTMPEVQGRAQEGTNAQPQGTATMNGGGDSSSDLSDIPSSGDEAEGNDQDGSDEPTRRGKSTAAKLPSTPPTKQRGTAAAAASRKQQSRTKTATTTSSSSRLTSSSTRRAEAKAANPRRRSLRNSAVHAPSYAESEDDDGGEASEDDDSTPRASRRASRVRKQRRISSAKGAKA